MVDARFDEPLGAVKQHRTGSRRSQRNGELEMEHSWQRFEDIGQRKRIMERGKFEKKNNAAPTLDTDTPSHHMQIFKNKEVSQVAGGEALTYLSSIRNSTRYLKYRRYMAERRKTLSYS